MYRRQPQSKQPSQNKVPDSENPFSNSNNQPQNYTQSNNPFTPVSQQDKYNNQIPNQEPRNIQDNKDNKEWLRSKWNKENIKPENKESQISLPFGMCLELPREYLNKEDYQSLKRIMQVIQKFQESENELIQKKQYQKFAITNKKILNDMIQQLNQDMQQKIDKNNDMEYYQPKPQGKNPFNRNYFNPGLNDLVIKNLDYSDNKSVNSLSDTMSVATVTSDDDNYSLYQGESVSQLNALSFIQEIYKNKFITIQKIQQDLNYPQDYYSLFSDELKSILSTEVRCSSVTLNNNDELIKGFNKIKACTVSSKYYKHVSSIIFAYMHGNLFTQHTSQSQDNIAEAKKFCANLYVKIQKLNEKKKYQNKDKIWVQIMTMIIPILYSISLTKNENLFINLFSYSIVQYSIMKFYVYTNIFSAKHISQEEVINIKQLKFSKKNSEEFGSLLSNHLKFYYILFGKNSFGKEKIFFDNIQQKQYQVIYILSNQKNNKKEKRVYTPIIKYSEDFIDYMINLKNSTNKNENHASKK